MHTLIRIVLLTLLSAWFTACGPVTVVDISGTGLSVDETMSRLAGSDQVDNNVVVLNHHNPDIVYDDGRSYGPHRGDAMMACGDYEQLLEYIRTQKLTKGCKVMLMTYPQSVDYAEGHSIWKFSADGWEWYGYLAGEQRRGYGYGYGPYPHSHRWSEGGW